MTLYFQIILDTNDYFQTLADNVKKSIEINLTLTNNVNLFKRAKVFTLSEIMFLSIAISVSI